MTSIAAFGDTSPPRQAQIARAVERAGHSLAVFLGDAVDEHGAIRRRRRMARWAHDLEPLRGRLAAIGGNHDYETGGGEVTGYAAALGSLDCGPRERLRFSVSVGGIHVVGLTIPKGAHAVPADDLTWCEAQFSRADPGDARVVAVHEPLYPVASRIGLSLDMVPASRDAFAGYLEHWKVLAVLCGHEHLYARRSLGPRLVQITSGGGGARPETAVFAQCDASSTVPHYVSLSRARGALTITAHALDGHDLDRIALPVAA